MDELFKGLARSSPACHGRWKANSISRRTDVIEREGIPDQVDLPEVPKESQVFFEDGVLSTKGERKVEKE
jgi:hypothetical protein